MQGLLAKAKNSGMPSLQRARTAASGLGARAGAMRGGVAAMGGGVAALKQRAAAVGANVMTPARAAAIKAKFGKWLSYRPPNIVMLFTNVLYVAVAFAVLILGLVILDEHAADFKRNSFEQYVGVEEPRPCGMPTPDGMKLLEGLGALGGGGWESVSLEPDYQSWMTKIDRGICAKVVPQIDIGDEAWVQYSTGGGAPLPDAHYLLALSFLMGDNDLRPTALEVQSGDLADKVARFETRACLQDTDEDGLEPFYADQQLDSYGDFRVRVGRAYMAAMPAFARYHLEKEDCAMAEGSTSPFDKFCIHAGFIDIELSAAAADGAMMLNAEGIMKSSDPDATPGGVSLLAMFYRLLALSLAGYHDRVHNGGKCFKNDAKMTAVDFCFSAMNGAPFTAPDENTHPGAKALESYNAQNDLVTTVSTCRFSTSPPPPSPAPMVYRMSEGELKRGIGAQGANDPGDNTSPWERVCAATLRYGLVEQGRLFGLPDITEEFVVDNRVSRSLHFTATWLYEGLYINPWKNYNDVLGDPKARLEAYMAYRLASTTVWGMIIANVCGFALTRAAVPIGVFCLRFLKIKTLSGSEIVLMRPKPDIPSYVTMALALIMFYWLSYIDPATQSNYYVTTDCGDWHGLGVLASNGAYVSTWGKRRFDRLGEYVIGILLLIIVAIFAFQQTIGRKFVSAPRRKKNLTGATFTSRQAAFVAIPFLIGIGVQLTFSIQAGITGGKWLEAAKANDQTNELAKDLIKDCFMCVWSAFWTGSGIAFLRQKWAVTDLPRTFKIAWFGCCVFCFVLPILQYNIYLSDEIANAFKNGRGTSDRQRNEVWWIVHIFTGLYGIPLFAMWNKISSTFKDAPAGLSVASVNKRKESIQQMLGATSNASSQGSRDITKLLSAVNNNMEILAPSACFSVDPSTLIAGSGLEEHQALIGGNAPTAVVVPISSYRIGRGAAAPSTQTGVTGQKVKYLPLLPMV
jgi:hypothetical protein